ncbi:hypothetical protein MRB53_037319 [Persea americana]|nr:hypothetical protein MRB53_037319 [Persea americana]
MVLSQPQGQTCAVLGGIMALRMKLRGASAIVGDIVVADPVNGVVVIPQAHLDKVIELLPKLTGADDKVKEAVKNGMTVKEAFDTFR